MNDLNSSKPFSAETTALILALAAVATGTAADTPKGISPERMLQHVKVLASDEFEGRAPGSAGEKKTVEYLVSQFKALGLEPGNPDGTFVQDVPLAGITGNAAGSYTAGGTRTDFVLPQNCVLWSRHFVPEVKVTDSELIFVGYGVVAPEYDWDDFKGVDVRGKTLVVLVGDPPIPDPKDPSKLDDRMFKGRAMTYYGRWTYKFEIAAEKGAAAALIVHETDPAGYPFEVVINSNTGELFDLQTADRNLGLAAVEGWVTTGEAKRMFAAAGRDYEAMKAAALQPDFKPVPLAAKANFRIQNTLRRVASRNVVGRLAGSDPKLRDDYILYTAHWDHLGLDPKLPGDKIYHGACDNATGVAALLEIAREFTSLDPRPKRSLLFMALTSEEQGLLGARHYAGHPLYPLQRTLANLNIDSLNPWGRTKDVEVLGLGSSTLDTALDAAAKKQGRFLVPDSEPERGGFFRADHFEFVKVGIPALYFGSGMEYLGKPADFGKRKVRDFIVNDYHKPTDIVKPDWDLSGAVEDTELYFEVGRAVAEAPDWPAWKDGSEYQSRREKMLRIQP